MCNVLYFIILYFMYFLEKSDHDPLNNSDVSLLLPDSQLEKWILGYNSQAINVPGYKKDIGYPDIILEISDSSQSSGISF